MYRAHVERATFPYHDNVYVGNISLTSTEVDVAKDGSDNWGWFGHFYTIFLHESPLYPWNSKDRSLYQQKSAHLDGQIPWNSMTHPWLQ